VSGPRPTGMRLVVAALLPLLLLAGCGSDDGSVASEPTAADQATAQLECTGQPTGHGRGDYGDGLEEVQDDPAAAVDQWLEAEGFFSSLPTDGYVVEWQRDGQALLSFDTDGRTTVAFVVADGVHDYRDETGWGVETWAQCDPAEWPAATTDGLRIGIWTDATGARMDTGTVVSYPGPGHCDWQDVTFLHVGGRKGDEYLRNPTPELRRSLTTTYDDAATLPRDATDTGWRRDGRELWVGQHPRAAYAVSVDDPTDVERWPASKHDIGCA
jgi:hypothetical protein